MSIKQIILTSITKQPMQQSDNSYNVHYSLLDTKTNKQKSYTLNYRYRIDAINAIKMLLHS